MRVNWENPDLLSILAAGGMILLILLARYVIMAGGAYLYFWVLRKDRLAHLRIQPDFPRKGAIRTEILYSLSTTLIFAVVGLFLGYGRHMGWFKIYTDFNEYGAAYFAFSIVVSILLHDAYFYFAHRLMHTKPLFRIMHRVHHESTNPSPFAAFSFHPTEAVAEAAILPILLLFLPMHPAAILVFMFGMTFLNVVGHLGYELWPRGFATSKWTFWNNTSTHHNMHHRYVHCNYGLYFNWWDRLFNTNHKDYIARFNEIKEQRASAEKAA